MWISEVERVGTDWVEKFYMAEVGLVCGIRDRRNIKVGSRCGRMKIKGFGGR